MVLGICIQCIHIRFLLFRNCRFLELSSGRKLECVCFGAGGGREHVAASVGASVASARCTQGRGRAVLLGGRKCSPSGGGGGKTPARGVDVAARGGTDTPSRPLHGDCAGTALLTVACGTAVPHMCARGEEASVPLLAALLTGAVRDDGAARVRRGWTSARFIARG